MPASGSSTSSDRSEAREQSDRPRRRPCREWWCVSEESGQYHYVDFGYEGPPLQLNDRGNLVGIVSHADLFRSVHPIHAGFSVPLDSTSPLAAFSDIVDVDQTQYEELNQAIRERVHLEGWSQQGALLPGQEALRRRDLRNMADHIDNQPREAHMPSQSQMIHDLLVLKDADAYIGEDGTIEVEKLNVYLHLAERCIARGFNDYIRIRDSTTSNYVCFLQCSNTASEAIVHLRNNLPHSFDSAAQFARAILKTRIALAALRLSIEWYYQQKPRHWDEMSDWPSSWDNLLKMLCEILPSLWKGVEGHKAAEHAARRVNATLLVLKTIGKHVDRAPSFLTMYTLRELGMVMLDGKPTDALEYQNWVLEPETTTSDKAWEEMRTYLTGHYYYDTEKDLINRLRSRGTRLYQGMANLCKGLLAHIKQMREPDVMKNRVSPQTYSDLYAIEQLLIKRGKQYSLCARNMRTWECDIRFHKRNMEDLAKSFDEIRNKINTQVAIMTHKSTNPENEDWLRKRHGLALLARIAKVLKLNSRDRECFLGSLCRYPRIGVAYSNLEKLVYRGEKTAVYYAHSWYANPMDSDEESAWNELKPLLDLDSLKPRRRKRRFVSNGQSFESRSILGPLDEEDSGQGLDAEKDNAQDARFAGNFDGV